MSEPSPTLAEFLTWPEVEPPRELVSGRVIQRPLLEGRERWLRADLATLLYGWARASHNGAATSGTRCTFGGGSYVPDVAYFSLARLPAESAASPATSPGVPDFVVEICPSAVDPAWFVTRLVDFVDHGVRLAWLVDPAEESVTVIAPGQPARRLGHGGLLEGGDVLPGFFLHVDDLFAVLEEEE